MTARAWFVITMAAIAVHGCGGDDTSSDAGDPTFPPVTGGTVAPPIGGTVAPPPPPTGGTTSTTPVDAGRTDASDTIVDAAATDSGGDSGSDASSGDDGGNDPCGDGVLDDGEACDPGLSKCCLRDCSGPRASGHICRPKAGDCDVTERCDGASVECPADEVVGAGTTCRAAEGECDVAEACDGSEPACPTDAFVTALAPCGDTLTDTECDEPDSCDGAGACNPRYLTNTQTCTDDDLTDCLAARCDGSGTCVQHYGTVPENTPCGDTATDTDCDKPDSCDVGGTCRSRYVAAGVQCSDTNSDDCDDAQCDGGGFCVQDHDTEAAGTPCLDTDTADCDDARCDATGGCVQDYTVEAALTPCGDTTPAAGGCDAADSCDALGSCDPRHVAAGTQCNDTDVDDCADAQCDGDGSCSQDGGFEADAYPCDGSSGTCWAGLCCQAATVDPDHDGACDLEDVEDDLVFVMSASSTGALGGLAGADELCNDQAAAANLAGTYVAWLSSSTSDAVNRIADGPFVRVDGVVVANDVADLIDATLDNAISKTELGDTSTVAVWTGTDADGTGSASGDFCGSWADGGLNGTSGASGAVDGTWTESTAPVCSEAQSLYCFQLDCPGVVNVDFANDPDHCGACGNVCPSGYCVDGTCAGIVFVTSTGYPGNLLGGSGGGGVADGDAICEMHASDGGFTGTFTAWLSGYDPGAGAVVHAKDRIDDQPYVLPDGTVIAPNGLADLTSASLLGPIDHDELAPNRVAYVWTGTAPDGTAASPRCTEWTSNSIAQPGVGGYTSSTANDPYWTQQMGVLTSPYPCSQTHTLYCFQNLP